MLTAFATLQTAVEAFDKQAFDYFTKPVRIDDLKESVARALKARSADSGQDAVRGPTGDDHD